MAIPKDMHLYGNGISKNTENIGKAIAAIMELSETYFKIHKVKINTAIASSVGIGIIYK